MCYDSTLHMRAMKVVSQNMESQRNGGEGPGDTRNKKRELKAGKPRSRSRTRRGPTDRPSVCVCSCRLCIHINIEHSNRTIGLHQTAEDVQLHLNSLWDFPICLFQRFLMFPTITNALTVSNTQCHWQCRSSQNRSRNVTRVMSSIVLMAMTCSCAAIESDSQV